VTRVFSRGRDMFVYLQAYERNATETQPLVAYVSFFKGNEQVHEAVPIAITDGLHPRSKAVPLRLTVPLTALEPGEYDCQVTIVDPTGQKAAFWRGSIAVVP
jgi:hypothetical protein